MDIIYTMNIILSEEEFERVDLPQEVFKYVFEHMEIGSHVWTTGNYSRTGKLIYKDLRTNGYAHMIISLPEKYLEEKYI